MSADKSGWCVHPLTKAGITSIRGPGGASRREKDPQAHLQVPIYMKVGNRLWLLRA